MTQRDFDRFAALSGDDNPIHVDAVFAAGTHFGGTVAHGMFLYSNICRALGLLLPGAPQLAQTLLFPNPTYAGDEVDIVAEITAVTPNTITLTTTTTRSDGLPGCQGEARLSTTEEGEGMETAVSPTTAVTMGNYCLGQSAGLTRTFTPADVAEYVNLVGDDNPIYGEDGRLPGALLGGLFSCLLGTELPGRGTNWLKQSLLFPHPAHTGEAITATVEIVRLRPEKHLVNLRTTCTNPAGEVVCAGEALVLAQEMSEQ